MSEELPVRKNLRLRNYDYSQNGTYFITICIKDRHELLGMITDDTIADTPVGDAVLCVPRTQHAQLTEIGESVKKFLENMNTANESLQLDNYVIMPNHVHLLITIKGDALKPGTLRTASPTTASPTTASPTSTVIPQIVHGMKSCTTRFIGESIWQRSYHDHIVRNEKEYNKIWNYINTNVQNWQEDCFYSKNPMKE